MSGEIDEIEGAKKKPSVAQQYAADQHEKAEQKMREELLAKKLASEVKLENPQASTDAGAIQISTDAFVKSGMGGKAGPGMSVTKESTPTDPAKSFPPNAVPFPLAPPKVQDAGNANSQQGGEGSSDTAASQGIDADAIFNMMGAGNEIKQLAQRISEQARKEYEAGNFERAEELLVKSAQTFEKAANANTKTSNFEGALIAMEEAVRMYDIAAKMTLKAA